jgi:hypothetical protein
MDNPSSNNRSGGSLPNEYPARGALLNPSSCGACPRGFPIPAGAHCPRPRLEVSNESLRRLW